ncbi:MAG: ribosomal protein S18-alanine N-acetyltransferase [Pyrinomonadaceae bacterium]
MSAVRTETFLSKITVVEMTTRDLEDVVAIENESGLSPWGRVGYAEELWNQEAVMLVARESRTAWAPEHGRILGFATARMVISAAELHVNNIAIGADHRRLGLGGLLLRAVLARGRAMGAVTGLLEVRASNQAAQALYRSYGFAVIGERRKYYSNPDESALVMRGFLPPRA